MLCWRFRPGGASVVINGVQFCVVSSVLVEFLWWLMVVDLCWRFGPSGGGYIVRWWQQFCAEG